MNNEDKVVWGLIFIGSLIGAAGGPRRASSAVQGAIEIADLALAELKAKQIDLKELK